MVASDWMAQAHNTTEYSAADLKRVSQEIAQQLQAGGKRGHLGSTKKELVAKAKKCGFKSVDSMTKAQIIALLRTHKK